MTSSENTRLFGEIIFQKGLVSAAQLYEALTVQARLEVQNHPHRFLGEILVDLGYLSEKNVLDILTEIHGTPESREILHG